MPAATAQLKPAPAGLSDEQIEQIDQFAQRIADLLARPGALDGFYERINDLLEKADALKPVK
jgi:hypothetical protein